MAKSVDTVVRELFQAAGVAPPKTISPAAKQVIYQWGQERWREGRDHEMKFASGADDDFEPDYYGFGQQG